MICVKAIRRVLSVLASGLCALPVLAAPCAAPPADFAVTAADMTRIGGLDQSRARGLASALTWENAEERGIVAALFSPGFAPPEGLPGAYQCRTIKLGGLLPLTVYGWFKCTIAAEDGGYAIRKTTGSQNFSGRLIASGSGYLYRGASNYGDEAPRLYGDKADENQVGCLTAIAGAPHHLLLELPSPLLESVHDVIELRPAR